MSRTKRDFSHGYALRRPRTHSERKKVDDAIEQGVKVRPKRNKINLPDSYDDKIVAAEYERIPKKIVDFREYFMFW